jgi:hypothetical protein
MYDFYQQAQVLKNRKTKRKEKKNQIKKTKNKQTKQVIYKTLFLIILLSF